MDPACWLWRKDPGFRNQALKKTSLYFLGWLGSKHQATNHISWVWSKLNFLAGPQAHPLATVKRQKLAFLVQACHMPWQPLQNHPSGHLGGWAMLWSAEEILDGQHQRVAILAHARTAHKGLLQKRLEEDLHWTVPHAPPMAKSVNRLNWTETAEPQQILGYTMIWKLDYEINATVHRILHQLFLFNMGIWERERIRPLLFNTMFCNKITAWSLKVQQFRFNTPKLYSYIFTQISVCSYPLKFELCNLKNVH